jgi:hypothetical protein
MLNMRKTTTGVALAAALATTAVAVAPAQAGYQDPSFVTTAASNGYVQNVAWHRHHHWHGRNDWVAPLIGGMVIGGLLAAPYYGYGPAYGPYYAPRHHYYYGNHDAYCHARFRSYNSATGLYFGYDGRFHRC